MADWHLDILDRRLLEALQDNFPLTARPWREIGDRIGASEDDVLRRVRYLIDKGIVLTISPVLESTRIGLGASTLIGMRVPPDRVDAYALDQPEPGVSHNYIRDCDYNLWLTLAARRAALRRTVDGITRTDLFSRHPRSARNAAVQDGCPIPFPFRTVMAREHS